MRHAYTSDEGLQMPANILDCREYGNKRRQYTFNLATCRASVRAEAGNVLSTKSTCRLPYTQMPCPRAKSNQAVKDSSSSSIPVVSLAVIANLGCMSFKVEETLPYHRTDIEMPMLLGQTSIAPQTITCLNLEETLMLGIQLTHAHVVYTSFILLAGDLTYGSLSKEIPRLLAGDVHFPARCQTSHKPFHIQKPACHIA